MKGTQVLYKQLFEHLFVIEASIQMEKITVLQHTIRLERVNLINSTLNFVVL